MSIPREEIINPSIKNKEEDVTTNKSVYFVSTYDANTKHPASNFKHMIDDFNMTRTCEKERLEINYSFRKSPSLKQLLMFRKSPGSKGVFKCLDGCTLCNEHLHEGDEIILKTGVHVKANSRFECTSRNVVYLIICLGCL